MMKRLIVATVVAIAIACGSSSPVGPGTNTTKPLQSLVLTAGTSTPSGVSLAPGSVTPLRLMATYSGGSTEDVASRATFTASNPNVLRVDGSQAVAIQDGDAGITAQFAGFSAHLAVTVLETGTVIIQGSVVDSGFPLAGARVEVLSGTGAGKATTTDASGNYKLFGVAGNIQMRASLDGYVSQTVGVTVAASIFGTTQSFTLASTVTPVDVAGNWDLTLDASPSCTTLPDVARRRTYTAAVAQTGSGLIVTLSGAQFAKDTSYYAPPGTLENQFRAHLVGSAVALTISRNSDFYGTHYDLDEFISAASQLQIVATGTGTATSSTISGTLDGFFAFVPTGPTGSISTCTAADHRFTFVRHSATSGRRR